MSRIGQNVKLGRPQERYPAARQRRFGAGGRFEGGNILFLKVNFPRGKNRGKPVPPSILRLVHYNKVPRSGGPKRHPRTGQGPAKAIVTTIGWQDRILATSGVDRGARALYIVRRTLRLLGRR